MCTNYQVMFSERFSKLLISPRVRLLSRLHYQRRRDSYLCSLLGGSGRGSLAWREFGLDWWSWWSSPWDSSVSPLLCFCRANAIILATRSLSTLKWKVFNKIYWKNGYFNQKLFPIALELFHLNVPGIITKMWIKGGARMISEISQRTLALPDDEPAGWSSCSSGGAECRVCAVAVSRRCQDHPPPGTSRRPLPGPPRCLPAPPRSPRWRSHCRRCRRGRGRWGDCSASWPARPGGGGQPDCPAVPALPCVVQLTYLQQHYQSGEASLG